MISVVVCTYNRAGPLQRFLARIAELGKSEHDLPWELVIIDNNSNDGTRDVVERMRAAGCRIAWIGAESGSQRISMWRP